MAISANNLPTVTEISYRVRYALRLGGARLIDDREREVNHTPRAGRIPGAGNGARD